MHPASHSHTHNPIIIMYCKKQSEIHNICSNFFIEMLRLVNCMILSFMVHWACLAYDMALNPLYCDAVGDQQVDVMFCHRQVGCTVSWQV